MKVSHLLLRVIAALSLVVGFSAALSTSPAHAHTDLVSSDPAEGAVLSAPPSQMVLTFSEELLPDTVKLSVTDDTGMVVRVLSFTVDGAAIDMAWPPGLPGRDFEVNYRVVSQDGHPVSGTVRFSAQAPASAPSAGVSSAAVPSPAVSSASVPSASTAAEPTTTSLAPIIAFLVGAGVLVLVAIVAVVLLRRRSER